MPPNSLSKTRHQLTLRILLATSNNGKVAEILQALGGTLVHVDLLSDYPKLPEPDEIGKSFKANAHLKALHYTRLTGLPTLSEDSGLAVEVLGGQPGIYSARLASTGGERIQRLWNLLADADPDWPTSRPRARFISAVCLCLSGECIEVQGEVWGQITPDSRGRNGFGYDPVFYYPPLNKTFAELTIDQKGKISHRARALEKLRARLSSVNITSTCVRETEFS